MKPKDEKVISKYMSDLGKKSVDARRLKFGKNFNKEMGKIKVGKKGLNKAL